MPIPLWEYSIIIFVAALVGNILGRVIIALVKRRKRKKEANGR